LKYKIYGGNFFIDRLTTTNQIPLSIHPKQQSQRKRKKIGVSLFTFDIQSVGKQMGNSGPEILVFSMNIN